MSEVSSKGRLAGKRIWVAGGRGMVGSALRRALAAAGHTLVGEGDDAVRPTVDLRRQDDSERLVRALAPQVVVLAAANVGGIGKNLRAPAELLYDNLMIEANVLHACHGAGVERLLLLGSTCIYPRDAPQPLREDALLSGPLEGSNRAYAVAKIAGVELCRAYRSQYGADFIAAMPTNLYGPGDNFDRDDAHVLPALLRRFHEAKVSGAPSLTVWGSGTPRREFMHVDDAASALVLILEGYDGDGPINVGTGVDVSIAELATLLAATVGYSGRIDFDRDKPDGTPVKRTDIRHLTELGFTPRFDLAAGVRHTYTWLLEHLHSARGMGAPDAPRASR